MHSGRRSGNFSALTSSWSKYSSASVIGEHDNTAAVFFEASLTGSFKFNLEYMKPPLRWVSISLLSQPVSVGVPCDPRFCKHRLFQVQPYLIDWSYNSNTPPGTFNQDLPSLISGSKHQSMDFPGLSEGSLINTHQTYLSWASVSSA